MNAVNWFEIPVHDLAKAQRFYEAVFDLKLSIMEVGPKRAAMFPMAPEAPGTSGSLMKAPGYTPSTTGTLVYFSVGDIDATLARVAANGGKQLMPKTSVGSHGFIAHFEDCEGNRVALHSRT
ncbi:MAG: VOC family protein [Gammaproteobacteria bacterium]|nr:VOC family protein [Gammaproteobacteria bacterium]